MEKQSLSRRVIFPVAVVMGIMIISINAYDLSRSIENRTLHSLVANISAILMFSSIWLGALFANSISFFRGASPGERLAVCLAAPVCWSMKVLYSLTGIYSTGELFFFIFHPLVIGCPVVALLCFGISEIWCRIIYKRRAGETSTKIFALYNTSILIISLFLTTLFLWQGGLFYAYNIYMVAYKYIFN